MSSGEGAEETVKDAADIAAFFKSDCSLPKCEQKVDVPSQLGRWKGRILTNKILKF
ncbi:hypothetical protein GJAV_G00098090, partial [Gymnothorax javanicus]